MTGPVWNPMAQQYEPTTVTLAEFLLARIGEDEARVYGADGDGEYRIAWARITSDPGFYTTVASDHRNDEWVAGGDHLVEKYGEDAVSVGEPVFDARRVLAECQAKRGIIRWLTDDTVICEVADPVMRLLALPYSSHPDYDEAWKP